MNDSFVRRALLALCAVALLLSLCFAIRVPYGDNPDETAHHDYIRLLIEERHFVRFIPHADLPEGAPSRDETHQPPLYYLLCVPIYAATNGSLVAVRMINVALQVATVGLVFFACRDLFPKRPEIALGAGAFVALLPIQAQLGGSINNDPLTTLFCLAMYWRLSVLVLRGQTMREALGLGVLFGLGLLTKVSVVQLIPAFAVAYFLAWRGGQLTFGKAFAQGAAALVLGTVIASPWLIRNTHLYGDPLAISIYQKTGPNFTPQMMMAAQHWTMNDYLMLVGKRSFATFWYFLNPNVLVSPPIPFIIVVLVTIASWLMLYLKGKAGGFVGEYRRLLWFLVLGVPLLLPFFVRFVLTVFQAQGRYFLPALFPVAVLVALSTAGRTLSEEDNIKPVAWIRVLWFPVVLLAITIYQLMGGGFVW